MGLQYGMPYSFATGGAVSTPGVSVRAARRGLSATKVQRRIAESVHGDRLAARTSSDGSRPGAICAG